MAIETRITQGKNVFADWKVKEYIGSGSGGRTAVFRIIREHNGWEELSALKVINVLEEVGKKEELADTYLETYETERNELCKQAEEELRLMSCLKGNPNIVDYYDFAFIDYQEENVFGTDLLIRMELLDNLREEQKKKGEYDEAEIIKIGKDICKGLQFCHSAGIIHRDIKPANIFVSSWGEYELGDFGIARMVDAGQKASTKMGTRAYAAPEQFMSYTEKYDERVDIYSLGLTLYELANHNRLPFASSGYVRESEIQLRIMGKKFPALDTVSPALESVIKKACAHDAKERYATAKEFGDALEGIGNGDSTIKKTNVSEREEAKKEKNSITKDGIIVIAMVAMIVILIFLLAGVLWGKVKVGKEDYNPPEITQDEQATETLTDDNEPVEEVVEVVDNLLDSETVSITSEELKISDDFMESVGKVKEIVTLNDVHAVITEDNKLYMWGDNEYGHMGNGTTEDVKEPFLVLKDVQSVHLSGKNAAAITTDGKLFVWGDNSAGQIGNGKDKEDQLVPIQILDNVSMMDIGRHVMGALCNNGDLYCWGYANGNAIGEATKTPVLIKQGIVSFSLTHGNGCAVDEQGMLYIWGIDWEYNTTFGSKKPTNLRRNMKKVVYGPNVLAALGEKDELYLLGDNTNGQLGTGKNNEESWMLEKVLDNVDKVILSTNRSAAITKDGELYVWGNDVFGEKINRTPQKLAEDVKEFYWGDGVAAFIKEDGTLYMYGSNGNGRIGGLSTWKVREPVAVAEDIVSVGLGEKYTYAVNADGRIFQWGN